MNGVRVGDERGRVSNVMLCKSGDGEKGGFLWERVRRSGGFKGGRRFKRGGGKRERGRGSERCKRGRRFQERRREVWRRTKEKKKKKETTKSAKKLNKKNHTHIKIPTPNPPPQRAWPCTSFPISIFPAPSQIVRPSRHSHWRRRWRWR